MDLARIRTLAEEYALQYNPKRLAPFPYENVLKAHDDLEILFVELEDNVSGVTLYKENKFSILVNSEKPETRQHFTLAHELGHYFLHQNILREETGLIDGEDILGDSKMLYRLDSAARNRVETEANNFAASLIMPADLVRRAWQATESIEENAQIFKVSAVAMSIRLTQLRLVEE